MTRHPLTFLILSLHLSISAFASEQAEFNVATYNIRQQNNTDSLAGNVWGQRCPVIADLIRFHGFDIFGTQEGFKNQLEDILSRLDNYAYTGHGRDDGKDRGEHAAIFYRTDMFELIDAGDFWLSETPDVPGSKGWDAALPRVCSWAQFRHIPSGREFMFFNLHMDHIGKQARIESADLIKQKIVELGRGLPAFVTGDFNVDQTHQSYATFTSDGGLRDSYTAAEFVYAPNGTFNSYRTDGFTTSRIDHIFVTPEIEVQKYGVLTDTYRTPEDAASFNPEAAPEEIEMLTYVPRTPSDHFPVLVRVIIP